MFGWLRVLRNWLALCRAERFAEDMEKPAFDDWAGMESKPAEADGGNDANDPPWQAWLEQQAADQASYPRGRQRSLADEQRAGSPQRSDGDDRGGGRGR